MSRLVLTHEPDPPTEVSNFHRSVSAYDSTPEMVELLRESLSEGIKEAVNTGRSVIVDQDCMEHIFVCHPAGTLSLYRHITRFSVSEGS